MGKEERKSLKGKENMSEYIDARSGGEGVKLNEDKYYESDTLCNVLC